MAQAARDGDAAWIGGIVMLLVAAAACAARAPAARLPASVPYLPTYVLSRWGLASACPIAPQTLLTSRHVVASPNPLLGVLARVVWGQGETAGFATVTLLDQTRDLAVLTTETPVARAYPLAPQAPRRGAKVTLAGYDFTAHLAPAIRTATLERVLPGHLVLSTRGAPGFSGSCVLADQGVVGVFQWGVEQSGVASSVWGDWGARLLDDPTIRRRPDGP